MDKNLIINYLTYIFRFILTFFAIVLITGLLDINSIFAVIVLIIYYYLEYLHYKNKLKFFESEIRKNDIRHMLEVDEIIKNDLLTQEEKNNALKKLYVKDYE